MKGLRNAGIVLALLVIVGVGSFLWGNATGYAEGYSVAEGTSSATITSLRDELAGAEFAVNEAWARFERIKVITGGAGTALQKLRAIIEALP